MPKWICPCCSAEYHGWAGRYQNSPCCGAVMEEAPRESESATQLYRERRENT